MEKSKGKVPQSRLPITRANVSLDTRPPAPKVHSSRGSQLRTLQPPPRQRSPAPPITLERGRQFSNRESNDYVIPPRFSERTQQIPRNNNIRPVYDSSNTITRQPEPAKDRSPEPEHISCQESIICPVCDRCKCRSCAAPRELPKKWMCGKQECSPQCAVETCTCLCVAKCVFDLRGISDHEHDMPLSDNPCACFQQPHCCQRWTVLGCLSICLPCLCFYPLLKGGLVLCTSCYNRCTRRGCTCSANRLPGSKRLLIDSENSSST